MMISYYFMILAQKCRISLTFPLQIHYVYGIPY
jgi:hypothetical protein